MAMTMRDPTTQLAFSMSENKGVYAVLLGSGVSRAAGIPTGWEITMELVKRAGLAIGAGEQEDWLSWYVQRTGAQPNYSALLEELATTQTERRSIIQRFLEPNEQELEDGLKLPTSAHHAIAAMVKAGHIRLIVTTNFDRLMENALRDQGIEPTVVSNPDTLQGAEPLTHSQCYILKIHGDYKDVRILNTDVELGDYPPQINALLDRIIDEFGLIVAGWSGEWDHALRGAIIRAPSRRYPTFWLSRGRLTSRAQELINHRKAIIANGDADSFFTTLQLKLDTLQATKQANPLSIDLTLALAKRFMAKPERRIQLDELISTETRRVLDHFSHLFSTGEPTPALPFTELVTSHEAAADPLIRLGTVLGRWGDGAEFDSIVEAIRALYLLADKFHQGSFFWKGTLNYPAALVFYGYGIGLTRAGRWQELHRLLNTPLVHDRYAERIGAILAPFFFESDCSKGWKELPGQSESETPLCNRILQQLLPQWAPAFAGVQELETLYEQFEMSCVLCRIILAEISRVEIKERLKTNDFHYLVFGRMRWNAQSRKRLAIQLSLEEYTTPLLEAGFAFGDKEYLATYVEGLQYHMGENSEKPFTEKSSCL
ncbi:hypothetical protein PPUJ20005_38200 [Pseudomonas putida]|uniref:SIR2 family protein n=1 Tax=Pseudomonas putida TaxID=303 RepID=UPI00235B71AD|nr:SIR2 family protein [Pseudomonas putida]GLO09851.1 hypothetical protein PPUJ20005_38200 [Pseudomonas putida]HDS0987061.1 SIR2 family protein [Pseudomonas putida]